jgi:hypothetical protein
VNKIRGTFASVAVKAPGFGDRRKAMLGDIAVLTGAQVISEEVGLKLETRDLDLLGHARRVVVTKDETTIVDGGGDPAEVKGRIAQIRARSKTPTRTGTARSSRSASPSSPAASPSCGRRGHRDRAEGEEAPHRRRALRDSRRDRRGHRRRWRHALIRSGRPSRGRRRSKATRRPVRASSPRRSKSR